VDHVLAVLHDEDLEADAVLSSPLSSALAGIARTAEKAGLSVHLDVGDDIDALPADGRLAVAGLIADELVNAEAALRGRVILTLRGRLLADAVVRRLVG
jgi:oxygen-independent coproporphyrinogen-3 oxidase